MILRHPHPEGNMATATKTTTKPKCCLVKGCKKDAKSRGLCAGHYQSAENTVKTGKATWAELEKLGVALAPTKLSNGFSEFLAAKRAGVKAGKNGHKPAAKKKAKPKAKPAPVKADKPAPTAPEYVDAGGMAG